MGQEIAEQMRGKRLVAGTANLQPHDASQFPRGDGMLSAEHHQHLRPSFETRFSACTRSLRWPTLIETSGWASRLRYDLNL